MCTFHPFLRLPKELRDLIRAATLEPRTVEVFRPCKQRDTLGRLVSSTPVPSILQVCREFRAQKLYIKVFFKVDAPHGTYRGKPYLTERRYVWLNFGLDIVNIVASSFSYYKHIAGRVQRLRFEREYQNAFFYYIEAHELEKFDKLAEMHVDCADGFWGWGDALDGGTHSWPCPDENIFFYDGDQGARGLELAEIYKQKNIELYGN